MEIFFSILIYFVEFEHKNVIISLRKPTWLVLHIVGLNAPGNFYLRNVITLTHFYAPKVFIELDYFFSFVKDALCSCMNKRIDLEKSEADASLDKQKL